MIENKIKVVLCEPNKNATIVEIGDSLESMEKAVSGYIEPLTGFTSVKDNVCIICNEEAKLFGEPMNRSVNHLIIRGTFFVCGVSGEKYVSLTDEQAEKYKERFLYPHAFFKTSTGIIAIPVMEVSSK